MGRIKYLLIIALSVLSGCASIQHMDQADELSSYQLYIDSTGDLLDPRNEKVIKDEDPYVKNIVDNFKSKKSQNPDLKMTIFIHGGLNSFENATDRVKRVKDSMLMDNKYPVFISWRSGGFSNYSDHLVSIRRGEKRNWFVGGITSPFVFAEDALRSLARAPASTYNVLFGQNSIRIGKYSKEEQYSDKALAELNKLGFIVYNSPNDTGHGVGDFWSVWNPVKLVTAPFVDGLGTGAWNSMLRRTDLVLRRNDGFNGISEEKSDTAVTNFFKRLSSDLNDEELILIGHSMGTIIANNIIARFQELNFKEIVYMAAACSIKDVELVVPPYMQKNTDTKFYSLSLNPYRDMTENSLLDFVPRGSLLVWIDDTLGATNSFQDKTAGFWFNMVRGASEAFKNPSIRNRVHLTQFGIKDGTPQTHGAFGDYEFWDERFWQGDVPL